MAILQMDDPSALAVPPVMDRPALQLAQQAPPGAAALFTEALALVRTVQDRDDRDEAFGRIAEARARTGDYAAARALLRSIGSAEVRDDAAETVALIAARSGAFDAALELASSLAEGDRRAQTQGRIARERAQAGDVAAGLEIAGRIAANDTRVMTLGFIAEIAARAGQREPAEQAALRTREAMARLTDPGMRDTMLAIVSAARARGGDHAEALEQALTITDAPARIGAVTELAGVALAAGDAPAALRATEALLTLSRQTPAEADRVRILADAAELQVNAAASTAAGVTLSEAARIADTIADQSEKRDAIARLAAARARFDPDAAIAAARTHPDREARGQVLAAVATALALSGRATLALELTREIGDSSFRDDARRRAVLALAAANLRQALAALDRMPAVQRQAILATMLEERAAAGDAAGALAAAERIADAATRAELVVDAIRVLAREHRDAAGALRLAERIVAREPREEALVEIAEAQARAGDIRAALATARGLRSPGNRAAALALIAARMPRP
jgi:hypothetical protein